MKYTFNTDEWIVWEQPASPMLLVLTLNPSMNELRNYLGTPLFTTLILFEAEISGHYQGKWVFRFDEGRILGQKMVDMLLCPPYRVAFDTGLEVAEVALRDRSHDIQFTIDPSAYSNLELVSLFRDFCQTYYDYYKFGAFVEPVQWHTEHVLTAYVKSKLEKEELNPAEGASTLALAQQALFAIEEDTFAVEITEHLLECAKALSEFLHNNRQISKAVRAIESNPDFSERATQLIFTSTQKDNRALQQLRDCLSEHSRRYYWKQNNYLSTVFLDERDVLTELFQVKGFNLIDPTRPYEELLAKIKASKAALLKRKEELTMGFSAYHYNIVGLANSVGGSLVDKRKRMVLIANAAFDRILGEASRRTNTPLADVRLLLPQEFEEFLENPGQYTHRFVERRKLFLVIQSDYPIVDELLGDVSLQRGDEVATWHIQPMRDPFLAEGEQVNRTLEQLDPRLNLFTDLKIGSDQLHGITAFYDPSEPELTGVVRVIRDPKAESLKPGEILVAPSTTPDYMDAIAKCLAIVTNWGGQTSHAAITARELRKPCIIGTNFAAQVLRNGDVVTIDFVHSVIRVMQPGERRIRED